MFGIGKKKDKDSSFSLDKALGKIGNQKKDDDFSFSDVPVLGTGDKKNNNFSFDEGPRPEEGKDPGVASIEAVLKVQEPDASGNPPPSDSQSPDGTPGVQASEPEAKWDKIARKKGKLQGKILYAAIAAVVVVAVATIGLFLVLKPKAASVAAPQGGTGPGVKDPKAEEEARRKAELEKMFADAEALLKGGKYEEAVKMYNDLLAKNWKEKELSIYLNIGECHEKLGQENEALSMNLKCIDGGWKENSQPYMRAARILNKNQKYDDAIKCMLKGRELLPADIPLGLMLAQGYSLTGQSDKAIAEFKKINKSDIPVDLLKLYASLLAKKNEKAQSKELYLYTAKKFRDYDSFAGAASMVDKVQEKIDILNQAMSCIDESSKISASMALAELYMQSGKKDDAVKQLEKVKVSDIPKESVVTFLKIIISSCGSMAAGATVNQANLDRFKAEYKKAIELYPGEISLHKPVANALSDAGLDQVAFEIYMEWWSAKPDESIAGYSYAHTLGSRPEEAIPVYKKVIALNPQFYDAYFEVGNLYIIKHDFDNAANAYSECVRINPSEKSPRYLLAMAKLKAGSGEQAIQDYESFLKTSNVPGMEKFTDLINLAQRLPTSATTDKYLEELKKIPKAAEEYTTQVLKTKLIYGTITEEDFTDSIPRAARKYHIYYLLSKGKSKEVLLNPTPPDEFPDFWKMFVLWRSDSTAWQENLDQLVAKYKNSKDAAITIISSAWSGKTTADDAKKLIDRIHPDNEALFYFMLAEKYKKEKSMTKASVCYQKALADKLNPIYCVVKYYEKQK